MIKTVRSIVVYFKIVALIVTSVVLSCFFRIVILVVPFKVLAGYIGVEGIETTDCLSIRDLHRIRFIRWAVATVSRYTPWKSLCLVQALTAQLILKFLSISSTLYLGVTKSEDKISAHAWLRSGSEIVTGGDNMKNFRTIVYYTSIRNNKNYKKKGRLYKK